MAQDGLFYTEVFEGQTAFGLKVTRTLSATRSELQRIEILETPFLGKVLALDGVFMTSVGDEFFYHEMIVHPALCTASRIERVLIIGGGDGGTAREVLRHRDVREVVMVEIDAGVVAACKEYLPEIGGDAWNDPRLTVRFEDGVRFVGETEPDRFDVVILDGSDPVGPAKGLFDRSFYEGVRRVLTDEGVLAAQSESPMVYADAFYDIQRTLKDVFGRAHPYFGTVPLYGMGPWTWTYASKSADPLAVRDARAEAIEPGCRYYDRAMHRAAFAQPPFVRRRMARDAGGATGRSEPAERAG